MGAFLRRCRGALGISVLLFLADGRKAIRDLSLRRAALWGMLGTAAFPLLTPVDNSMVFIFCPIGAALAAASVAFAKKADLRCAPPKGDVV